MPGPVKTAFAPVLLLAALCATPAVSQQIQLDNIPGFEGQRSDGTVDVDPRALPHPQAGADATQEVVPSEILMPIRPVRPQAGNADRQRLQGEYARASFVLFMPADPGATTLKIASQSAINVLPDRSDITVEVNGKPVGTLRPDNFETPESDIVEVPAGVLVAGRNRVDLVVRQVHRVFCGPSADFALWTDIMIGESGVTVPSDMLGTDALSFFSAMAAQLVREGEVHIQRPEGPFPVAEVAPVIARVGDLFGGVPPVIHFEDYYSVQSERPELARLTIMPSNQSMPGVMEFRRGGDGAIVLVTNREGYQATAQSLLDAIDTSDTAAKTPELSPGGLTTLSQLGVDRIEGRGRYIDEAMSFALPWDWLLLASQEAELRLDYRYDTDLPEGSLLVVKINETSVRLLPLDVPETAGRPLPTLRVPFRASLMKPGINRLTFEALIPGDPPDETCAPRDAPAFEISGGTALRVPDSPRMSVPGIDRVLGQIGSDAVSLSEAAQRSLPLGLLPQVESIFNLPGGQAEADTNVGFELVIGRPSDLAGLEGDVASAHAAALQSALVTEKVDVQAPQDPWETVVEHDIWGSLFRFDRLMTLPGRLEKGVAALWEAREATFDTWLEAQDVEALMIQPDFAAPGRVWMILGPRVDTEALVAGLASVRGEYEGPSGQVAVFSKERGWQSWASPDRPVRLHEPLSIENMRAVVGNFATVVPASFILPLTVLTLLSAIVGIAIALITRRNKQ